MEDFFKYVWLDMQCLCSFDDWLCDLISDNSNLANSIIRALANLQPIVTSLSVRFFGGHNLLLAV